jgi:DNA-binding transcriptional MerR regulator
VLRLCQDAGFTLDEIRRMNEAGAGQPGAWRDFVQAKLVDVEQGLERLQRAHRMLRHTLECTGADITQCPHYVELVGQRMVG